VTGRELEALLRETIPLSGAMEVAVLEADPGGVLLEAPLEPNRNHRDTAFGGSLQAVAILAGWSLLRVRLNPGTGPGALSVLPRLVIQRCTMEYGRPVHGAFRARALPVQGDRWTRFLHTLERRGRARIPVEVEVTEEGERVGSFRGEFVALTGEDEE